MKKLIDGRNYEFFCGISPGGSCVWMFRIDGKPEIHYPPDNYLENDLNLVVEQIKKNNNRPAKYKRKTGQGVNQIKYDEYF